MGVHCPKKGIYRYWSVAKWSQQRGWTWYYHTVCSHTVLHGPKVGMLIPFAPMVSHGEPMIPSFTIHINPPSAFVAMAWSYHVLPKPKQCPVQVNHPYKLQPMRSSFLRCMKAVNQCIGRSIRHARRQSWCQSVVEKCQDVVSLFLRFRFNEWKWMQ